VDQWTRRGLILLGQETVQSASPPSLSFRYNRGAADALHSHECIVYWIQHRAHNPEVQGSIPQDPKARTSAYIWWSAELE